MSKKEMLKCKFRRYLREIKSKYGLETKAEKADKAADKAAFQQALQIACRWETASEDEKSSVLNYIIG